jgi:hypothetical protein
MLIRGLQSERGFTLVEALVAMVTGLVVVSAAFTILEVSLRQSTRIADRVSADQRGRVALEKVMLELHSSCVSNGANPILANSSATNVKFLSQTGSEAFFTSGVEHEVYLSGTTLYDAIYKSIGGNETKWDFNAEGKPNETKILVTNVYAPASGSVFEYYAYNGTVLNKLLATKLTEPEAKSAAQVNVNLSVAPESGYKATGRPIALSSTAVLRLTPASETKLNPPCE